MSNSPVRNSPRRPKRGHAPPLPPAESHLALGGVLWARGNLEGAEANFRQALALRPDDATALANLGAVLSSQGKAAEADVVFQRLAQLGAADAQEHFRLGQRLGAQGQWEAAAASYRRAVALAPNHAAAHLNLGNVLLAQGKLEAAIASHQRALQFNPNLVEAHTSLGAAFAQQGWLEEAEGAFRQALALAPRFAHALVNLGVVLTAQGRLEEALAAYRHAMSSEPRPLHPPAGAVLGVLAPEFFVPGINSPRLGRNFASVEFTLSLLHTGLFAECHFFSSSHQHPVEQASVERFLAPHAALRPMKTETFLVTDLLAQFHAVDYAVFLVPDIGFFFLLANHLREACNAQFRLLGLIHSLSYFAADSANLAHLLRTPLRPGDTIICSSSAGQEALLRLLHAVSDGGDSERLPGLSLATVPYAIDTERLAPGEQHRARQQLSLSPNASYLLSVARFTGTDKFDYRVLLRAFHLALQRLHGRWRLLLAGAVVDPPYYQHLQTLVEQQGLSEHVAFWPDIDEATKRALYQAADLFISPSDNVQETFGLSVVEAMASGLPVIVSDWNGYKDTVKTGLTGLRVATYMPRLTRFLSTPEEFRRDLLHVVSSQAVVVDLPQLVEAIVHLGNDAGRRHQMGTEARREAEQRFSHAAVSGELCRLLQALPPTEVDRSASSGWRRQLTPWSIFSHYPTRALAPADRIHRAETELPASEARLRAYLNSDLVEPICQFCEQPRELKEVLEHFGAQHGDHEGLLYTIYWLLKHGALALA